MRAAHCARAAGAETRRAARGSVAAILAAVGLAGLSGCGAGLPDDVAACDYVSREHRFALDVPEGWQVRESRGAACLFLAPPGPLPPGAGVIVTVESAGPIQTLDELVQVDLLRVQALRGYTHLDEGERTLADGHKAATLTFEHSATGERVRQRQLMVLAGGQAYTVTATATPPEAFADRADAFEIVFRSFRAAW